MRIIFQEPMPFSRGLGREILFICVSGCGALFVFYLIRPLSFSGLNNLSLLGFGVVSILSAIVYVVATHFLYIRFWEDGKWTVGKEILHSLCFLLFIAAGILIYGHLNHTTTLDFENAIRYLLYTLLLGLIPVIIRALLLRNWRFKKDLVESQKINELFNKRKIAMDEKLIEFPMSRIEKLQLTNQEIIYIESSENYLNVVWNTNNSIKKAMIRMTMKEAITLINDPLIVFCHRSYIINLRKVKEMIQQSGSSAILLIGLDKAIPVSPRFKTQIKQKLQEV